jgi:putative membrane protein
MKSSILIAVASLFLAYPSFAESMGEKTGVNSALGIAPRTSDFVKEAAIGDMFEIQSSQLALTKGDDAAKAFATQMIAAHTKTTEELKGLVAGGKVQAALPTGLDGAHEKMLDKLKGLSGGAFDKQYDSDQVAGHKDAESLFSRYAKSGENPALKDWASQTLPMIEHHLEMAQGLKG